MTNFLEDQLTAGMRERVAGITITTDVVGETLRNQRRRTMIARTASAFGVIGLAGALTAGVLVAVDTGPASTVADRPPVAGAGSPELRLAAAVAATQATSYRVKMTINHPTEQDTPPMIVDGGFDPAATTGYLRLVFADGSRVEDRLVGGDWYTATPGTDKKLTWWQHRGKYTNLVFNPKSDFFPEVSTDPQSQFDTLKQSGAKITQTRPDTYHFEAPTKSLKQRKGGTMIGDVTVGADQRVAKIAYAVTLDGTKVLGVTMDLSDYGVPVTVDRPSPSELPKGK